MYDKRNETRFVLLVGRLARVLALAAAMAAGSASAEMLTWTGAW